MNTLLYNLLILEKARVEAELALAKAELEINRYLHKALSSQKPEERLTMTFPSEEQIRHEIEDNWFIYHAPNEAQIEKYHAIRESAKQLALTIFHNCPPGADRSAALRIVRDAVMTANAAIACHVEV